MAAGQAVLGLVAAAPAAFIGGITVAVVGSKQKTSAKSYAADVDIACENIRTATDLLPKITERITELSDVLRSLVDRADSRDRAPRRSQLRPGPPRFSLCRGTSACPSNSRSGQHASARRRVRGAHRRVSQDREEVPMNPSNKVEVVEKQGAVVNPLDVVQMMLEYSQTLITEVHRAETERTEISAWRDVQVGKIQAQRDVLLKALDLTFDERRENFRRLFDGLDSAMAAGDPSQTAAVLESITDLAKTSPFKELANLEIVVSELKRPDQVWDV